ncbi:hypothetical protein ACIBL8_38375 [Streptomyces sp. NPDC050523]|uniref:hypothetical protein n=1 Tax=Streptomyces sp. NPDC050523 TaxID=3365622 RepID=UPI00378D3387
MAGCAAPNPIADFFSMLGDPVGTVMDIIAKLMLSGAIEVFQAAEASIPSVDLLDARRVSDQTRWLVSYLAVGSLLFAAVRMALDRRGEAGQIALKGILRVIVVSATASTLVMATFSLAERYSDYLLQKSLEKILTEMGCGDDGITSMLLMIIAFLLLISAVIHIILLYVRLAVMTLLLGTLPLAASASMTEWGGSWWRKHLAWITAWLLYKPTVGLVIYAGAEMVSTGPNAVQRKLAGMAMLLLSSIALPALLKLIVPATAALGGDAVGQATMGVAGGLATGAKSIAVGARNVAMQAAPSGSSSGRDGGGSESGSVSGSIRQDMAMSQGGGSGGGSGQQGGGSGGGSGQQGSGAGGGDGQGGGTSEGGAGGSRLAAAARAAGPVIAAAEAGTQILKGAANVAASGVQGGSDDSQR